MLDKYPLRRHHHISYRTLFSHGIQPHVKLPSNLSKLRNLTKDVNFVKMLMALQSILNGKTKISALKYCLHIMPLYYTFESSSRGDITEFCVKLIFQRESWSAKEMDVI